MTPLEAKKTIDALANGIDPETGEVFPFESVFNSPLIIRALFVAAKALDKAVKNEKLITELPDNVGRAWSIEEDNELMASFDTGNPVKDIAEKHRRTLGAITSRLAHLGRIKDRAGL